MKKIVMFLLVAYLCVPVTASADISPEAAKSIIEQGEMEHEICNNAYPVPLRMSHELVATSGFIDVIDLTGQKSEVRICIYGVLVKDKPQGKVPTRIINKDKYSFDQATLKTLIAGNRKNGLISTLVIIGSESFEEEFAKSLSLK